MNALDMAAFCEPKSDQINADDLIGGPRTITITKVSANEAEPQQPINVYFDGDGGKPYRPCKSMRRVMVAVWGADASKYVGRSMTLYRDPNVQFGGMQVGGIRISHMSHIDEKKTMALTATRAKRAPFTVQPLANVPTQQPTDDPAAKWASAYIAKLATFADAAALQEFVDEKAKKLAELEGARPDLHQQVAAALARRTAELAPGDSGFDDDDLTDATPEQLAEKNAAEESVEKVIAQAEAAADTAALEQIIADQEKHKPYLDEQLQMKLEIAFDKARQRLAKQPESEAAE